MNDNQITQRFQLNRETKYPSTFRHLCTLKTSSFNNSQYHLRLINLMVYVKALSIMFYVIINMITCIEMSKLIIYKINVDNL